MFPERNETYYYCPICGIGPFGRSIMSSHYAYFICECCGSEAGLDDTPEYKKEWLAKGTPWFYESEKPKDWNLEEQLKYSIDGWSCWLPVEETFDLIIEKRTALGWIDDSRTIEMLTHDLNNNDRNVRLAAIHLLEWKKNKKAVEPLLRGFKHDDPAVRIIAVAALIKFKYKQAVKPLIDELNNDDPVIRRNASIILGEIGNVKSVKPLIQASKDKDKKVRTAAVDALGKIRERKPVE